MRHRRDPVRHTCPDVDSMLTNVSKSKQDLECALSRIDGMDSELEKLRKSNEELREWGTEEAHRVDELEGELDGLRCDHCAELSDMRDRAERAEARVTELEREVSEV